MDWIDTNKMQELLKRFPERVIEAKMYRPHGKSIRTMWSYDAADGMFVFGSNGRNVRMCEHEVMQKYGAERWLVTPFFSLRGEKERALAVRMVEELVMRGDIDWVIEECGIGFVRTCQHCHRLMDEGWWCGETWTFCSKECMLAENRGMSEAEMEERMENGDIEWMEWKMGGKRR